MYNLTIRMLFEKVGFYRSKSDEELLKIKENSDIEHLVPLSRFVHTEAPSKVINYTDSGSDFEKQLQECRKVFNIFLSRFLIIL